MGGRLLCKECILRHHEWLPLHRVEVRRSLLTLLLPLDTTMKVWNHEKEMFEVSSLLKLGATFQLGAHANHEECPTHSLREMVVLHTNGVHRVNVKFCSCDMNLHFRQQLMRVEWWPATTLEPYTAATFEVLRLFHYSNLQGNMTMYDFYRTLEFLTDGRLSEKILVRLLYLYELSIVMFMSLFL